MYTYTGRLHLNPKYAGIQSQIPHLNSSTITIGSFYMALRDFADQSGNLPDTYLDYHDLVWVFLFSHPRF